MSDLNLWELKRMAKQRYPSLHMQRQWLRQTFGLLSTGKHVLQTGHAQYGRSSQPILTQHLNAQNSHKQINTK